jgi:hypothetical protein
VILMNKRWMVPGALLVCAASVTVWGQANAGPPPAGGDGVVVNDVARQSSAEDFLTSTIPSDAASSVPEPSASPSDLPSSDPASNEEVFVPAEVVTEAPAGSDDSGSDDSGSDDSGNDLYDDKGGLRPDGVSDDGPDHDVNDDKGGLRPEGVSDDGPDHDINDDKGGLREDSSGSGKGRGSDD